jgi:hypothetical protein
MLGVSKAGEFFEHPKGDASLQIPVRDIEPAVYYGLQADEFISGKRQKEDSCSEDFTNDCERASSSQLHKFRREKSPFVKFPTEESSSEYDDQTNTMNDPTVTQQFISVLDAAEDTFRMVNSEKFTPVCTPVKSPLKQADAREKSFRPQPQNYLLPVQQIESKMETIVEEPRQEEASEKTSSSGKWLVIGALGTAVAAGLLFMYRRRQ